MENRQKHILAVVGMAGTGKSSAVEILVSGYRLPYLYFGDITLQEVKRQGLPETQENERTVRHRLRNKYGMGAYAQMSLPKIRDMLQHSDVMIIDGLYSWSEYSILTKSVDASLLLISIISRRQTRYNRLASRAHRPLTPEEAEKRDFDEIERMEKGGPIALCDYYITNDGTFEDFERAIHELALELRLQQKD